MPKGTATPETLGTTASASSMGRILQMLSTAKFLINADKPSDGYTALFEKGRLDLTVEAMVVEEPRWYPLFTEEELTRARKRLSAYGYPPRPAPMVG